MPQVPSSLLRAFAWSALLLGLATGCRPPAPTVPEAKPDADRSSVEVSRAQGVLADGNDAVEIQVTVRSADGAALPGHTVRVAVSGEGNTLTQAAAPTDGQGIAMARLTSTVAGTKTVTASVETDAGTVTLKAQPSIGFHVLPARGLVVTAEPASGTAGVALGGFEVSLQNGDGELVSGASDVVTVAIGSGPEGATLKGTLSIAAVDGVARFSGLVLEKAGPGYTLVASAEGFADTTSASFDIHPAAASQLVLVALPSGPHTAGASFTLDVSARDDFGNPATGYRGTVHFASSDPLAILPADAAFAAADSGHQTRAVTLTTAGADQTVSVQDVMVPSLTATAHIEIAAATPAKLAFQFPLTDASVRATLTQVRVRVTDAFGNAVGGDLPEITVALAGGNPAAALTGTLSATPIAGVASFTNLSVDQQGQDFRLEALGGTLDGASSTPFTIVDDVAPSAVSLEVSGKTSVQLELGWKAPGDDRLLGNATRFELRSSTSPIDEASFGSAQLVVAGPSLAQDMTHGVTVAELIPSTPYHFALKVEDDASNASYSFASTSTYADPCALHTCPVSAPTCAADGVSRISFTAECTDVGNVATCTESQTSTACTGTDAVCVSGACDTAAGPTANQLGVTEVMHSPSSSATTEYFELTNTTDALLDLRGLTVTYENASGVPTTFQLDPNGVPLVIGRRGRFVLAHDRNAATNGGVEAALQYPGTIVLDGSGRITVSDGDSPVAELAYTPSFPQTVGKAMSLSSVVIGTGAGAHPWYWCDAESQLPGGDFGTPVAANSTCGLSAAPTLDFCNVQSPKTLPTLAPNTATDIHGRLRGVTVTDRNTAGNDRHPWVVAQLGHGAEGTSADTWSWAPVAFNDGYHPPNSNEDEVVGALTIATAGSYRYGFRYAFRDPVDGTQSPYVYCDQNGLADPATGVFGAVTVAPPALTDHVVISEFSGGNGTGTAATDEFVELYNPTDTAVDLAGWTLQYKSATGTNYSGAVTINGASAPGGTIIQPRSYFLLGGANYSGAAPKDASYAFDASSSTTGGGHVRIGPGLSASNLDDPKTVDKLGWGTANSPEGSAAPSHPAVGGSLERKAVVTSTTATMAAGGADASRGNGHDTGNNGTDFVTRAVRNPQSRASPAESP